MALGTVASNDPVDPSVGVVTELETGKDYPYQDKDFVAKGLSVGSTVTYDIDYTIDNPIATNLQAYVPQTTEITTVVNGPITVSNGETYAIRKGGMVNGNVNVSSANLVVEDTGTVNGDISVTDQGNMLVRKGGMVNGNVNISSASALKIVNKGVVKGNVNISSANRLIIGNNNDGGFVTGEITIEKVRKVTVTATSKINC